MLRIITILTGALALAMTSAALADKLDPKWSAARQEANRLGDAAKAGQAGAYQALVNKAALGDAPALHNIGWLYQSGFPGVAADRERACGWFGKAAKRAYPRRCMKMPCACSRRQRPRRIRRREPGSRKRPMGPCSKQPRQAGPNRRFI